MTQKPATTLGGPDDVLQPDAVSAFIAEHLAGAELDGRSVCVLIPDATRRCPVPLLLDAVHRALAGRVSRMTAVVALGTHNAMDEAQLGRLVGFSPGAAGTRYPGLTVVNHEWWLPEMLVSVGSISAARIAELSEGRLRTAVDVRLNRRVVEHDVTLVVGPVFPHEVVGFSGGNKYLFPGVSGPELIDLSHWLGALITSAAIIGTPETTPVRALIDEAAALVPTEKLAFCVIPADGNSLRAISFGDTVAAWAAATAISAQVNVRYLDAPVPRVLSIVPPRYDEIWTAAKGFYKLEPVVADGGEVVLYAPHVTEFASSHPEIREIGYHCRDYFVKQWDRFSGLPWGVLAHSTHLRGAGTWDPREGERDRVTVTLATGIPEAAVRSVNLDYRDPAGIDPAEWGLDPDTFVVPEAGEILYRLRSGAAPSSS